MLAGPLDRLLRRQGIHYGWVMAALVFCLTIGWSAAASLPGVLTVPITGEFGWDRTSIAGAVALMYLLLACISPFSGALQLRYGVARVAATSAALIMCGLAITAVADAEWHFKVGISLCFGTAAGLVGLGLPATVASRWFVARRGLVMGILTAAFAAGQLIFVPVAAWLGETYGWRYALLPVIGLSAFSMTAFLLFARNWPADLGLAPFGETRIVPPPAASDAGAFMLSIRTLVEARTSPMFWALATTFFVCGLSSSGLVQQHFVPFCADRNVGAVVAASYLALMGVFNFAGTVASGWLSDRFDNRVLLAMYYGLRGASLVWLPFSDFSIMALTLWAIFFGLDFVATVPPTVRLTAQNFGTVRGPVLFGWIFAAHQIGSATAAYGAGATRDTVLTYLPAFVASGIACFCAATLITMVRSRATPAPATAG
jgi:predicted MFS family arabinose efflux permease